MQSATEAEIRALCDRVVGAKNIVGFTGAGISTECGVPDFRSPNSPWMRHKPIPYQAFVASAAARAEAWRRKFAMDDLYQDARPGRGHQVLAALLESGKMSALITQNIDNLHQASGVAPERIIELHGNGSYAKCLNCNKRFTLRWVRERFESAEIAPDCDACQGYVKSATISFGQAMPVREMQRAEAVTLAADLFLCVGSSLVVYPAAGFPRLAVENGAKLVIINAQETELDGMADIVIHADIGTVLSELLSILQG